MEDSINKLIMFSIASILVLSACSKMRSDKSSDGNHETGLFPVPAIEYQPRHYVCYRTAERLEIDGNMAEDAWLRTLWTEAFTDIEGTSKPTPRFNTRVRMLWDSSYFYVAARMEEPHLWATLTERDAVIYHDNDFEIFIDPNGDSHEYYELEINALGTVWDLLLIKPYRDGAPAVNAWDITGLKSAVALRGTLNDASDIDSGWSVEIAIPWPVLAECAHRPSPPQDGDVWWVNFSRVQWLLDVHSGGYEKQMDSTGEKPRAEDNWVWSPQGLIAMHYPEMWGLVQFSHIAVGREAVAFVPPEDLQARWALRQVYYAEREYEARYGKFTPDFSELVLRDISPEGYIWPPELSSSSNGFEAIVASTDGLTALSIDKYGRIYRVQLRKDRE